MNTSLLSREPQLLVDIETGKVLRGDDHPVTTRRWADSHPFIEIVDRFLYAGPEAVRAAAAARRGESTTHLDVHEYEIEREVAGSLHLVRSVSV